MKKDVRNMIRYFGLAMVVSGLAIFTFILTLGQYRLTEEMLAKELEGEVGEAAAQSAEGMLGKTFTSNIAFVQALGQVLEQANDRVKQQYGLSDDDLSAIMMNAPIQGEVTFSREWIEQSLQGESKAYQRQKLLDYTDWMEGRSFDSKEALKEQLERTRTDIQGGIAGDKGLSDYTIKNLKFLLTKSASVGIVADHKLVWWVLSFGLMIVGGLMYFVGHYHATQPGIKNDGVYHRSISTVGWAGIGLGIYMIVFYVVLYFYPEYLTNWVLLVDPISTMLNGNPASQWFLYGFMYTLAVVVMGVRMLYRYRHSAYHIIRTISVMFFQLAFAFIIPEILVALHKPGYDFKNIWPLDYDFFYSYNLEQLMASGAMGWFMLIWGIALIILAVPIFTYFLGKRWYCSWVCGCGGLAENLGDPFRHLSDKRLIAWQIERWLVHGVLVFAVVNTIMVLYAFFTGSQAVLGINSDTVKMIYGFLISSIFAGVVGTGFYPLMGNRVWCRFGCPLAAYLGLVQRFKSRFRITTNGGQCISCGNCSTYCEMGIDVRWYAQRGQSIIRSSCVGCGICASVCPRGVLRLENGPEKGRFGEPILLGHEGARPS
jgi:Pyruvate/2-oxoacid:ferredoxin oxidoreductase delta subunit